MQLRIHGAENGGVTLSMAKQTAGSRKGKKPLRHFIPFYLMALPGIVYLFINNYMPLPGIVLAFKKYNARLGIWGSHWVGFSNFKFLFATNDAFVITRNTLGYNLAFIVVNTVFAVGVAILLADMRHRIKRFYQSVILLPYMISMVIVSYLVFAFLSTENGFINNSVLLHLGMEPVAWYMEPAFWPLILILVNLWKVLGYNCIVYLSAILSFDKGYYEAAAMDGATKWQQIRMITLPLLKPVVTMMTLLAIGRIFYSDFGLFYQVPQNSGALFSVTNTIDTYVYRGLLELGDFTLSAAAGLYQSVVGFILVLVTNLLVRRLDPASSLF